MDDFLLNDIGMAFLAFWGMLTFLLFWYYYKLKPLNDHNADFQELNEEKPEIRNSLFETLREKKEIDHSTPDYPNTLEQPTIDDHRGKKQ